MARVVLEWVGLDTAKGYPFLSLSLEFPEWDDPLPRIGDSILPPTGPMYVETRDGFDWTVSSVTWELSGNEKEAFVECIRIVIHDHEAK